LHFYVCGLLKLLIIIQKGTLLEYSYPPLIEGQPHSSSALPVEWKSLPALALPDGAHHHETDSSYFLLPLPGSDRCVFGVSFYRQIETEKLKVKTADVCRETVQKYQKQIKSVTKLNFQVSCDYFEGAAFWSSKSKAGDGF
jgi:hypothetical protein